MPRIPKRLDSPEIFIPTYNRDRVLTWESLPESLRSISTLVVHPDQERKLSEIYPAAKIWVNTEQGRGEPIIKQSILNATIARGKDMTIIMDDDLAFQEASWEGDKKVFRKASDIAIAKAFHACVDKLKDGGVGITAFGVPFFNSCPTLWIENRKAWGTLFIDNRAVEISGARFDGIPTMGDVYMNLGLATNGFGSRIHSNLVAIDRAPVGGETSLCGRAERHETASRMLNQKWPRYVKLRQVVNNARHMKTIGSKIDITVYFSRAVKENQRT